MTNHAAPTVTRGYVLVRAGGQVSAIVQKDDGERMARRFGGRLVDVKGLAYRSARGTRVLADPSEALAR